MALVTSQQTAAFQEMLKVLRRYPWLARCCYPGPVQGTGAAAKIAAAVAHLNQRGKDIDVILLARGGGSLEDLWAFNEEVVARAVADSVMPIVTGIGHEVDTTIADLVADYHAHTPTEAAQTRRSGLETCQGGPGQRRHPPAARSGGRASPMRSSGWRRSRSTSWGAARFVNQLRQLLDDRQRAMSLGVGERLRGGNQRRVTEFSEQLEQPGPQIIIGRLRRQVSDIEKSLAQTARRRARLLEERLQRVAVLLRECHPKHQTHLAAEKLSGDGKASQPRHGRRPAAARSGAARARTSTSSAGTPAPCCIAGIV